LPYAHPEGIIAIDMSDSRRAHSLVVLVLLLLPVVAACGSGGSSPHPADTGAVEPAACGQVVTADIEHSEYGVLMWSRKVTNVFDADGNLTGYAEEHDTDGDGALDLVMDATYTYAEGLFVSGLQENDYGADGTIDARTTFSPSYDTDGNLETFIYEFDSDVDGQVDGRYTDTNTYDASGNMLTSKRERDYDGDGIVDEISTSAYTYDASGNMLSEKHGGTVTTYIYGADGKLIQKVVKDGIFIGTTTYAYDGDGNLSVELTEDDYDGDGAANTLITVTHTRDADGTETLAVVEEDYYADGTVDAVDRLLFRYEDTSCQ
jgi:YD repeat-containing protein